jgi:hypothetical protein
MPWYVFALVDAAPSGAKGRGLSGPLALRPVPGGYAVVERRADVPPAELGSLERHHDVVTRIASRVPAIIPVRFGTLLDEEAIEEALDERGPDIAEAFDAVRDRVQFTWRRRVAGAHAAAAGKAGAGNLPALDAGEVSGGAGAEYLRRAARAARPVPPAAWRTVREKLRSLISSERYQPAAGPRPEALYHLVARDTVARYTTIATALRDPKVGLTVSGPFPPFAFVPEVL